MYKYRSLPCGNRRRCRLDMSLRRDVRIFIRRVQSMSLHCGQWVQFINRQLCRKQSKHHQLFRKQSEFCQLAWDQPKSRQRLENIFGVSLKRKWPWITLARGRQSWRCNCYSCFVYLDLYELILNDIEYFETCIESQLLSPQVIDLRSQDYMTVLVPWLKIGGHQAIKRGSKQTGARLLNTCDYQKESKDDYHTDIDTSHSDNDEDNESQSSGLVRIKCGSRNKNHRQRVLN